MFFIYMEDAFTTNIKGVSDLVESGTNKIQGGNISPEGASSEKHDVLDLPMSNEELSKLRYDYEKSYAPYEGKIKPIFQRNLNSYLGRTKDGRLLESDQPGAANLQFEAEETFLPATLSQNPDPTVFCDNTPEGNKISNDVKTMLQFHGQQLLLKRKLEVLVRQWSIYHLSVIKPGWDGKVNDIALDNRKIQDFVFDPDGYVDVYGDFSSWLGERIHCTAEKLIELYPSNKDYITLTVAGKLGTKVTYTEWWTDEYCFITYKDKVLEKHKNEYFNYEDKNAIPDPLTGLLPINPRNHFAIPKKPYVLLSVFSLQERPHDITGLIEQNIPNQAKITKRVEQIDINVSKCNNSELYSENNFNQETAKQAANAIRNPESGQVLIPPGGPIGEAIVRLTAPSFPESAFRDLENSENHLRSSWGTQGTAAEKPGDERTARGMILNQGRDTSRIGGGITNIIEQSVAASIYNWFVQLYMVFYDEKHFGAIMGTDKSTEYVELSKNDITRQLVVGVTAGSMKPKDEVSKINMAQALFDKGAIGPKTLLATLDFPNAEEAAADGILYKVDPQAYMAMNFPEVMQKLQQFQQQAQMQAQAQQQQAEAQNQQAQVGQKLQQGQAEHEQKLAHSEQNHQQKIKQTSDIASAKLNQIKLPQ